MTKLNIPTPCDKEVEFYLKNMKVLKMNTI